MERFEYKTLYYDPKGFWGGKVEGYDFDNLLNGMGAQGWELVSAVSTTQAYGSTKSIVCIFKRRVGKEAAYGN